MTGASVRSLDCDAASYASSEVARSVCRAAIARSLSYTAIYAGMSRTTSVNLPELIS